MITTNNGRTAADVQAGVGRELTRLAALVRDFDRQTDEQHKIAAQHLVNDSARKLAEWRREIAELEAAALSATTSAALN